MAETPSINSGFVNALLGEDELGCVIRSHLYVEAQLDSFLELAFINSALLSDLDLSYAKKVDLACCLGFDPQFRGALKRIGKLRNAFAHNLSSRLTKKAVSDLYNALPEFGRRAVDISVTLLHESCKFVEQPSRYELLSPKMQFVLIALNLERISFAACDLLRNAKHGHV